MKGLSLYIVRQIVAPFAFFTVALTVLVWITQSLRVLDVIINQGQSAGTFLQLALYLLPSLMGLLLPVAIFCAVVFAMHRLQSESELVVMWSAGFGRWGVTRPVLLVCLFVTMLVYLFNVYLMPAGMRAFKDRVFEIRGDLVSVLLREGNFTTPFDKMTVYVREIDGAGIIHNIFVHDTRKKGEPETYIAERGQIARTKDGPRLVMWNGNVHKVTETGKLAILNFDQYTLDLSQFGNEMGGQIREASERYIPELLFPDPTSAYDARFWPRLLAEGHSRLATPLYAIALPMIALAGLMSGQFTRRGYSKRIAAAVGIAVVVRLAGIGLQSLAAKAPMLNIVQYLLPIAAIIAASYVIDARALPFTALVERLKPAFAR